MTQHGTETDAVGAVFAESFRRGEHLTLVPRTIAATDIVREILPELPAECLAARIEALEQEKQALLEERDDLRHRNQDLERELADWKENGIRAPLSTPDDEEEPF